MATLDWYVRAGMKLRHLQILVALDDLGKTGKVAALFNVSQPAISKALGELQAMENANLTVMGGMSRMLGKAGGQ